MSQADLNRRPPAPDEPHGDEQAFVLGAGLNFTDPNSPLAPYYARAHHVALVALLGFLFVWFNLIPLWHTDIWGHLAFGRWIVGHGRLPTAEPFSAYSDPGAAGLDAYWLGQSGLYLVYEGGARLAGGSATRRAEGGVQALRTLHAAILVIQYLFYWLALRRMGCQPFTSLGGLILAILLGGGHQAVMRPQVFGEFFLICLLLFVSQRPISRRSLLGIPLIFAIWAGCHGSFMTGIIFLGCCVVGATAEVLYHRKSVDLRFLFSQPEIARLWLVLFASILAIAVFNPHGPWIFAETARMGRQPNVLSMNEWQPISWTKWEAVNYYYLGSMTLVVLSVIARWRACRPHVLLLLVAFGIPPLLHQRFIVWWLLLVPWMILPLWAERIGELVGARFASVPCFRKTLIAGLLVFVAAAWSTPGQWLSTGKLPPLDQSLSDGTPWQFAAQLHPPHTEDCPAPTDDSPWNVGDRARNIFASEMVADYLVWSQGDPKRFVIYSHVHLFPEAHWLECLKVKFAEPGWQAALDVFEVDTVLVESDLHPRLRDALHADPNWEVVLDESGDNSKPDPRNRLLLAVRRKPS